MANEPIDLSESLQDPETEIVGRAARRFRLRSMLVTLVISVLVVIVGYCLLYLTTTFDPFTQRSGASQVVAKGLTSVETVGTSQPAYGYEYKPGAKLLYAFTLQNNSKLPVEVIGFPRPPDFLTRLKVRTAGTDWVDDDVTPEGTRPFKPFRLEPGEERWIIFDLVMPGCSWFEDDIERHIPMSSTSNSSTDSFTTYIGALGPTPVRYRVFGLPRQGTAPVADPLGVAIPNVPRTKPTPKPHPAVCQS